MGGSPTITQTIEGIWCLQASASADRDVQGLAGPDGRFVSLFLPPRSRLLRTAL
jgi:hypothetical protein